MLAPAQAQAYLRSELDKHARLVERAGVQPQ
jgi:hypothetical protein